MNDVDFLPLLARWLHVASAIALVGGAVFLRFVLMPAAKASLTDAEHLKLRQQVVRRWRTFVHIGIGLLLLTGLYNWLFVRGRAVAPMPWQALMGVKFLIALVVFFIASVLIGRSAKLQPFRDKASFWLGINVALATAIVLMSGYMKQLPNKPAKAPAIEAPR